MKENPIVYLAVNDLITLNKEKSIANTQRSRPTQWLTQLMKPKMYIAVLTYICLGKYWQNILL